TGARAPLGRSHDPPTPYLYPPPLHDALPIYSWHWHGAGHWHDFSRWHDNKRRHGQSYYIRRHLDVWGSAGRRLGYPGPRQLSRRDRKSTRLNSSHVAISYAVFLLKKNNQPPD